MARYRSMWAIALVAIALAGAGCLRGAYVAATTSPAVHVAPPPHGGIQPQVVVDGAGTAHFVFFRGDPVAGDLYYTQRAPRTGAFSPPVRVNDRPGAAVAVGTIRGPQLAVGPNGTVHVVWFGSRDSVPGGSSAPFLYARLPAGASAFTPARNLMRITTGLDGGGSIAVAADGTVFAVWHAVDRPGAAETARRVWLAVSRDEGATFSTERAVDPPGTGVCPCCMLRAHVDRTGVLTIFYRAATGGRERGMHLLRSADRGATFRSSVVHPWSIDT